ncbi:MAG: hypothetical protein ACI89L_002566 [Phycisphaerales bacterium]
MSAHAAQPVHSTVGRGPALLDPPAADWAGLIRNASPNARAERFREQLGLPSTTPLIVTGHQPIVFHPGILAKYLAADALANATGGSTAWLVADQDTPDVFTLRRPARADTGELQTQHHKLSEEPVFTSVAVASQKPIAAPARLAPPFDRVSEAFAAHAGAPNLAAQAAMAVRDLLSDLRGDGPADRSGPPPLFFASRLHETDLFNEIVDAIGRDPARCVRTYNEAASAFPGAHLRALGARQTPQGRSPEGEDLELPLWRIEPGQPRVPVFASQLAQTPRERLAPRATLLDGLVRLAGSDLFIHGTGGTKYAQATDAWFAAWAPVDGCGALAPAVTATASRTIDTGEPLTTRAQADHAVWAAHHARHTPTMLDDPQRATHKAELLRVIEAAPRRSPERAARFAELTALLDEARRAHADAIRALDHEATSARARAAEHEIAADRTWPFPAYPDQTLHELAASIRAEFVG